jgi:predicted PolB exonuclease-like 3'-5' exonuclease
MWLDKNYRLQSLGLFGRTGLPASSPAGLALTAERVTEQNRRKPGSAGEERSLLKELSRFVDTHRPSLVTYNGRTFDLPVLALRSLHCGVPMGWYYEGRLGYRYSRHGHIDLCDWLADHGAARSSSLDALARLIGLPGKVGVDGSQVEALHHDGKTEQIENYCLADVAQTALLFLRFRLLQGVLSRDQYCAAVTELTAELRADPRLSGLTRAIDGERLLSAA